MKWSTTLFGVLLCLCALPATRAQSQTVATDASPGEFPYVVNLNLFEEMYPLTVPGLVVSGRYLLTSDKAYAKGNVSNMQIIDQQGTIRAPVKIVKIASNKFIYVKFCEKFSGAKYPMTASAFNDLATNVSASMILFNNGTSPVLKKVAALAFDSVTCAPLAGGNSKAICVKQDATPGFCNIFYESTVNYRLTPMLAINGQVQGSNVFFNCLQNGDTSDNWFFDNINSYRSDIINAIPSVDIK